MKKYYLILVILLISPLASAVIITDPVLFEIYSGTIYITIHNQTATFFNVSTSEHWLDIDVNNTHFNFTTTSNMTITNITSSNGVFGLNINGTGILTIHITTNNPFTLYPSFIDNVLSGTILSDSQGTVAFNFTADGSAHNVLITTPAIIIQNTLLIQKNNTCGFISNYEVIIIVLFSIGLMILGLSTIMFTVKAGNYFAIISGITMTVFGFTLLILGNYILSIFFNILC